MRRDRSRLDDMEGGGSSRSRRFVAGLLGQIRLALSLARLRPFDTGTALGRSNERYRRIALTTLSTLLARGMGAVTAILTVPIVLGHLGKATYGLWSAATMLLAWAALFDLGIANGLVNCISRAHGRDDRDEARSAFSTALAILIGVAFVLAILLTLAAPVAPWSSLLAVRGVADEGTVRWTVVAALGTFIAGMPLSIVSQVYAGYQKAYVANAFGAIGVLVGFALLVGAVRADVELSLLVLAFGSAPLLASSLGLVYAFVTMPWLRPRFSAVTARAARALLERSVPLFLFQFGALAVTETQVIVLAHRCDLVTVAEYSVVSRMYVIAAGLVQVSTMSFVPTFREARERGDRPWVRAAFRQFLRVRMFLALGAAFVLAVLGNALLRLWLGRSDIAFGAMVWAILALLVLAVTWVQSHTDLLAIMDRLWVLVALALANGVVTLSLTYALAPGFGVLGAVAGTAATTITLYSWIVPRLARPVFEEGGWARDN